MKNLLRRILSAGAVAAALLPFAAMARDADTPWWHPDGLLLQAGGGQHVQSAAAGLVWDTDWHANYAIGAFSAYVEADIGQWRTSGRADDRTFTQLGVTPMLRFHPRAFGSGWFVETGIGANAISPLYDNGDKRFSTAFNFGDRMGVGRRFGERNAHEITLRIEHFSNAGIKKPNPGENFVQLLYAF
jgi:lipid A 3-O-deacylase